MRSSSSVAKGLPFLFAIGCASVSEEAPIPQSLSVPPAASGVSEPAPPRSNQVASPESEAFERAQASFERGRLDDAFRQIRDLWLHMENNRARPLNEDLNDPFRREVALLFARVMMARGEASTALDLMERLIQSNPGWEPVYLSMCDHYARIRAWNLLAAVAGAGVDSVSRPSGDLFAWLGWARLGLGSLIEARRTASRGLEHFSEHPKLLWLSGVLAERDGSRTEACSLFAAAYAKGQTHAGIAHNHAVCLAWRNQTGEALSVARLAIQSHPDDARLRFLHGELARQTGDLLSARRSWHDYLGLSVAEDPMRAFVEAALLGERRER